jgi:hypothetical protein
MTTAIEIFQVIGTFAVGLLARAALTLGVVTVLAVPLVAYAYATQAAAALWRRLRHAHVRV